jgi:very-short-patch-repair endonuclease
LGGVRNDKLGELARAQGGVFARWQAIELGFGYGTITRKLASRQWRRIMGCVLASATISLDDDAMEWAAYLACGVGAVLSGPSALRRHGLESPRPDDVQWVTVPAERHVSFKGVRLIREALPSEDVELVGGMRVTSVERSIVDTLRVFPVPIGQPLLDRALLRGWLTVEELTIRVHHFSGRRGVARLRDQLDRVREGARSEAERRLHELLAAASITGWTADYKVYSDDGQLVAVIDVAFAEDLVAVEIDGLAFHSDPGRFQRDRTRQNWLTNQGWTVLRFTWDDLTQRRRHVLHTIRAALRARQDPSDR